MRPAQASWAGASSVQTIYRLGPPLPRLSSRSNSTGRLQCRPPNTSCPTTCCAASPNAAAAYDRENRFFQEDFDDLKRAGYLTMAVPKELGGRGMTLAQVLPRAAPARLPRARHGARHQHARLLGRTGRRSLAPGRSLDRVAAEGGDGRRGVQRRPLRARQRPSRPALHQQGREGGRRIPHHRPQDVRQPGAGLDALRPARDVGGCRWRAEDRARLPAAQPRRLSHRGDLGHDGHARDAQRRCEAGGCVRARQVHRADRPGRRRRCIRAGHVRLGAARLRQRLLWRRAARDGPGTTGAEVQDLARG